MRKAIVIGCSHYADPAITDLQYAHTDATRFATTLKTYCDFRDGDICILADDVDDSRPPTRDNVLAALLALLDEEAELELLVVYFSGHGFRSELDDDDYLANLMTNMHAAETTSVKYRDMVRICRESRAHVILFVIDACRVQVSSAKSAGPIVGSFDIHSITETGLACISSCESGAFSYEDEAIRGGLFTVALCEALSPEGKATTIAELDDYLRMRTPEMSRALGRPTQRPQTAVDPLALQQFELVAQSIRDEWRRTAILGQENRVLSIRPVGRDAREDVIAAIDFGTTYSASAVPLPDGDVEIVSTIDETALVPSVVAFGSDGSYWVGIAAEHLEGRPGIEVVRGVKRLLGSGMHVQVHGRMLSPESIASLIIRSLRRNVEEAIGRQVSRCMAAYPADFGIRQVNSLLHAYSLAGLDVIRMVGEPNIAAVLMAGNPTEAESYLVVDLGGGTFDVAVVESEDSLYQIKSVAGNNKLGGLDYDKVIADELWERLRAKVPDLKRTTGLELQLRQESMLAKHRLGRLDMVDVSLSQERFGTRNDFDVTLTRTDIRKLTKDLDNEIVRVTRNALEDSPLPNLRRVLLTGQGTRIFTVEESLREVVGDTELIDTYQDRAVVLGLARYSQVLTGDRRDMLLLDLSHRGIGLRLDVIEARVNRLSLFGRGYEYVARMSTSEQAQTLTIVDRLTTIPAKRSIDVEFIADALSVPAVLLLEVVERSKVGSQDVDVGKIAFPTLGQSPLTLEVALDVDANSAMVLELRDFTTRRIMLVQLNQSYRRNPVVSAAQQLRLILDGWGVYPFRNIHSGMDDSDDLQRLVSLDVDRWSDVIMATAQQAAGRARTEEVRWITLADDELLLAKLYRRRQLAERAAEITADATKHFIMGRNWAGAAIAAYMLGRSFVDKSDDKLIQLEQSFKDNSIVAAQPEWRTEDLAALRAWFAPVMAELAAAADAPGSAGTGNWYDDEARSRNRTGARYMLRWLAVPTSERT